MSTITTSSGRAAADDLPQQGLEALLELFAAMRGRLRDALRDSPGALAPMHQRMLRHCLQHPGASQQALAQASGRDKGQIARLIKELETQGLLVREADPSDGRMQRLRVTAAGRAAHQRFRKQEAVIARRMFEAMTAGEIEGLIDQLGRLRETLLADASGSAS
jgi:DNA-binding MarR family transcriptional regulator